MQIKGTTVLNRTATGLVGRQCEPWIHQPLVQRYMESSASSCYQLYNGESARLPWCYQLDVYNSTHLEVIAVALYSDSPDSCAILGVLAQDAILWGRGT